MKCIVRGEKLKITNSLKDYVTEKLRKIEKYLVNPDDIETKVLMSSKKLEKKIEITLYLKNYIVRAEEINIDMYAAIDLVVEKLEKQIIKYKSKISEKHNKKIIENDEFEDNEAIEEEIVKIKKIFLKPMNKEEATTQMELLSHTFFMFKDSEDLKIKVIYKRKDGNYGIIESE
jgi:putative sigma-54 modulation protein